MWHIIHYVTKALNRLGVFQRPEARVNVEQRLHEQRFHLVLRDANGEHLSGIDKMCLTVIYAERLNPVR